MEGKKVLERELERWFSREAKRFGVVTVKMALRFSTGIPDRIVILPLGRCAWVELKTLTGRLSPRQSEVISMLRSLDHDVHVLRTKQSITEFFEQVTRG
jgi:hypothetical protein